MKPLQALQSLKPIQSIEALSKERKKRREIPLGQIELILYSTNICYHSMKIIRGETVVQNRTAKLNALMAEVAHVGELLKRDNYYLHSTYTKENTKKFFKDVGIRPEHLKH